MGDRDLGDQQTAYNMPHNASWFHAMAMPETTVADDTAFSIFTQAQ
ncbi:MAG: hypothetical protein H7327_00075 [Herminiimonas sp.]|nr:hypothetical protein [Herminiimonas sp.]